MLSFIPTDNLYKFLAQSGISVFIFVQYFSAEELSKEPMARLRIAERNLDDGQANLSERDGLLMAVDVLRRKGAESDSVFSELFKQVLRNEQLLELKQEKVYFYTDALRWGSGLSVVMAVVGFFGWVRIQRRQDQLLFRRAPRPRQDPLEDFFGGAVSNLDLKLIPIDLNHDERQEN